jgi:cold shock CspA family protein
MATTPISEGEVAHLILAKGFGFIRVKGAPDVFFHQDDLTGLDFDERLHHQLVRFEMIHTDKGIRRSQRAADLS